MSFKNIKVSSKTLTVLVLALSFAFMVSAVPRVLMAEDGTSVAEEPALTIIETGNAAASGSTANVVNSNEFVPETPVEEPETINEPSEELPPEVETVPSQGEGPLSEESSASTTPISTQLSVATSTPIDAEIENENDAVIENEVAVEASSGENDANGNGEGGSGMAIIDTGNAYAFANVLSVANTNIFDSEGFFTFLNNFLYAEDLDLRGTGLFDVFESGLKGGVGGCPGFGCGALGNIDIENKNNADIRNNILVEALTGSNEASGNGDAYIGTGNPHAAANVINVANTNIVGSRYILLTFNNFGEWMGDLVLPTRNFFEDVFGIKPGNGNGAGGDAHRHGKGSGISVSNENVAEIETNVSTNANTGENEANGNGGTSVVQTGNAHSGANVLNQVNTNILDENTFVILFRVHGNWTGNIFGVPDGISWMESDDGLYLFNTPSVSTGDENGETDDTPGEKEGGHGRDVSVLNKNKASITNNNGVYALTGANKVSGNKDDALIQTGNAYAAANVINVANTNVVGRNWIFAIFNIFGNWGGDVSFGRPDLWLGARAEIEEPELVQGGSVLYRYTIINNGDAMATNVVVKDFFHSKLSHSGEAGWSARPFGEHYEYFVGSIAPGGSAEISVRRQG